MKRLLLLPVLAVCAACSNAPQVTSYLSPYRIDVRQGNFVTQDMVSQLKPGQSREQVRFILGSPLVVDMFHADRWDYIYRLRTGRGEVQQRHLAVFFEDGKLVRVAGDVVADEGAVTDEPRAAARVVDIAAPEDTGRERTVRP